MIEMESEKNIPNRREIEEVILNNHESLENFTKLGFNMLVEATKKSNNLPAGKSRDLYESYPSFHTVVENQTDFMLSMLSVMLKHTNCKGSLKSKDDDDRFEMIVDSNDSLLENVGILLDELSGVGKNPEAKLISNKSDFFNSSWNKNSCKVSQKGTAQVLNEILNQTKNIEKPQLKFKDKINNDSKIPFEPRIKFKYNMLKPLSLLLETSEDGICQFTHPYEFELEKFKPLQEQMTYQPPILYKSLEETPLVLVTRVEEIDEMVKDLERYKEIAVDLEHHSYRSFQGFTCLMQISTKDKDYIIDTLSLKSDLEILNKVFTKPSIVKVFHGASSDVLWLQRDFSLYVVNMFDTYQAAKLLNFPKLSLSYLLSHYCHVEAQKQFQLADWRVRPLPDELLKYAREDTHYLLFIYENLRNALIEKAHHRTNLLKSVISESTKLCSKRYLKPTYRSDGYLDLYHRSKKLFDNRQKLALQGLFEWRDIIARDLDESYAYVLPDHMMLKISEVLPREAQGILACCNPVPTPVRQNLATLHQIILKAREQQLLKPVLDEQRFYKFTSSVTSFDNPLQCPHDLNHDGEFRDDLPVLFNNNGDVPSGKNDFSCTIWNCFKPIISVFEMSSKAPDNVRLLSVDKKSVPLTPYHRYKLSKKFSESTEIPGNTSLSSGNKEQNSQLSNVQNRTEKPDDVKDSISSKETDLSDTVTDDKERENTSNCNKRQIEDEKFQPAKKLKEDNSRVSGLSAGENTEKVVEGQRRKKRKKMAFHRGSEKTFQPFDYSSVDFQKYQNWALSSADKSPKKINRKKRKGQKTLKIP